MTDRYFVYRPLLDLIGHTEGTDDGDGYNETLAFGKMLDGVRTAGKGRDVVLTAMTLDEIDALQTRMLRDPDNTWNSSAVGRYQIVRTTLRKIRKQLGLLGTLPFSAETQDRMACYLLGGRGIDRFIKGAMTADQMIDNLAKEWASLPTTADKGYYGGQHARVDSGRVRNVLAEVKRRAAAPAPAQPATPHMEAVVADADKPMLGSTTVIGTAVTTATGAAAAVKQAADAAGQVRDAGGALIASGPWALLVVVIVGFGAYVVFERRRKARAARMARLSMAGLA